MGYDVSKAKKAAQQIADEIAAQRAANAPAGGGRFFKATTDKKSVRVLPADPALGATSPIYSVWQHFFGGKVVVCPKMTKGQPCKICEFVGKLVAEGKRDLADDMKAKLVFKAIVSERAKDGEPGMPQIWTFYNPKWYNNFIEWMEDEDYEHYYEVDERGHDFRVYMAPRTLQAGKQKKQTNARFNSTTELSVNPRKQCALSSDPEVVARIMEERAEVEKYILETQHACPTSAEVEHMFDAWKSGDGLETTVGGDGKATEDKAQAALDEID